MLVVAIRVVVRGLAAVAVLAVLVGAGAGTCLSAKTVALTADRAAGAGTYRAHVTGLEPAAPGLTVAVRGGDEITLENRSGREVVVLGYAGEPYLRFTGDGVDENVSSVSSQLTAGLGPVVQGRSAAPAWRHRGDGPAYTWRDLRIPADPGRYPSSAAAPGRGTSGWSLPLRVGGRPVVVRGAVHRTGSRLGSPGRTALVGAVLVAAAAGVLAARRRGRRDRGCPEDVADHLQQTVTEIPR